MCVCVCVCSLSTGELSIASDRIQVAGRQSFSIVRMCQLHCPSRATESWQPAALLRSHSNVLGLHRREDGDRNSSETLAPSHVRKVTYRQHSDSLESRLTTSGGNSRQFCSTVLNKQRMNVRNHCSSVDIATR